MEGSRADLSGVEALYTDNLSEHGLDSKAVGWKDEASQLLRFEKLGHLLELARPADGYSVNDLGCGYGAMFTWLDHRDGPRLGSYRGYDISPEMLDAARREIDDPRASFVHGSRIDAEADLAFVSGTFNVRLDTPEEDWQRFVEDTLLHLAETSRLGIAFNLLSTYVDWRDDALFYGDPAHFFDFCKRNVGRRVALLHDYPLWEWTIVALRDEP